MKMPALNGNTKVAVSIGFALALIAGVWTAGASWSKVEDHAKDTVIHEGAATKEQRIDRRINLHLKSIDVRLDGMDKKIDRIDRNLQEFTNKGRL